MNDRIECIAMAVLRIRYLAPASYCTGGTYEIIGSVIIFRRLDLGSRRILDSQ